MVKIDERSIRRVGIDAVRSLTLDLPYLMTSDGECERRQIDLDLQTAPYAVVRLALEIASRPPERLLIPRFATPPIDALAVLEAYRWSMADGRREHPARQPGHATPSYVVERTRWVAASGSERLKLAAASGYEHDQTYIDERAQADFAGLDVYIDRHGRAPWSLRANPTEAALQLERVVSLSFAARDDIEQLPLRIVEPLVGISMFPFSESRSSEALLVDGWLGRFNVFARVRPFGTASGLVW